MLGTPWRTMRDRFESFLAQGIDIQLLAKGMPFSTRDVPFAQNVRMHLAFDKSWQFTSCRDSEHGQAAKQTIQSIVDFDRAFIGPAASVAVASPDYVLRAARRLVVPTEILWKTCCTLRTPPIKLRMIMLIQILGKSKQWVSLSP